MTFNPASVYEIKSISLTSSGLVLFTNTDNQLAFSCKATDNIQVSGGYIIVFTESGEFKIDVKPLESIVTPTTTLSYTPSSPTLNTGSGNYARLIDTRFAALANNVFQGCCRPAGPVVIGGLLVEFADYATMIGSAPGSPGVLYMTQDNDQLYRWDGSNFVKVDGYLPYANFSAFPVTGLEGIFYYDEAEKEMYVWSSSLSVYESLCCDATQVVYKHLQVAHGFSVGEVIYVSADGTFALAQADNIATSYVAGFVIEVPNANTFRYVTHGTVTVGVPAFAGGTLMYLSATTPGALTNVAPTSPDIVRPVMMVVDNGSQGIVFLSLVDSSASSGTVTSVDLTMPPAFAVSGNPITGAGTLAVTGAGVASQYVRGDGTLANFPSSLGGGASTSYYLNGSVNQGVFGGNTYYEMNRTPIFGPGTNFNISTNGYIASFITDANDPSQLLIPAGNWNFELFFSASSGGGSPNFYVELYKYDGVTFTLIASTSTTPEGITGGTAIDAYLMPLAVPATTLALTDRLAVRVYVNNSGRTITLHTEGSNLCQVITTFTTGITALNGLTDQVQNLNTGTSGSDFGISSAGNTHTFNLPVASATDTGKLSNTDWSSFDARIPLAGTSSGNPVTGTIQWEDTDGSAYPKVLFYQDATEVGARFEVLRDEGGGFYLRQYNLSDLNEFIQIAFDNQANLQIQKFNSGVDWGYVFQNPSIEEENDVVLIKTIKKRFWTKAGTPTTTDDNTQGFIVGSLIWDTTNSILYHCTDNTTGAAVWRQVGPVITSGTAAPSGGNDGDIYLQYV